MSKIMNLITYDKLPLISDFAKNTSKINILKAFLILIIYASNKLIRLIVKYFLNFLYITGYLSGCIILVYIFLSFKVIPLNNTIILLSHHKKNVYVLIHNHLLLCLLYLIFFI